MCRSTSRTGSTVTHARSFVFVPNYDRAVETVSMILREEDEARIALSLTSRHLRSVESIPLLRPTKNPQGELKRYFRIEKVFRETLQAHWTKVEQGEWTLDQFRDWFAENLPYYQVYVYMLGQRARGDWTYQLDEQDRRYLHGQYSVQMRYLTRFLSDVAHGRGRMDYRRRLDLYAKDLYGLMMHSYWHGQTYTVGRRYVWHLTTDVNGRPVEHCVDCVKRAQRSRVQPYTWKELTKLGLPGEGKTRCLNNCRCWIEEISERHYKPRPFRRSPKRTTR